MNRLYKTCCIIFSFLLIVPLASAEEGPRVEVANGVLEGTLDKESGIRSFKGIPFAAPPVNNLRWKAPQPARDWDGVRSAANFGPKCMQLPLFGDMRFRAPNMSEDCLYLNVWAPTQANKKGSKKQLPVLVYFYGGGFNAGDGSEYRYDGASMAKQGIVTVTMNYRLGPFGFLAHPALTKESPHKASGNYGLLDQRAALQWVRENIDAFGGDPARVTIAGESAGSMSVSGHMASPLSKGLFAGAIGESGSLVGAPVPVITLEEAEQQGVTFVKGLDLGDSPSLKALRLVPAADLLETASESTIWFQPIVDGYFMPKPAVEIYAAGQHNHAPLLAGANSAESHYSAILRGAEPSIESYKAALKNLYPKRHEEVFNLYPASTPTEVLQAAQELASDRFISYGTWKWMQLATRNMKQPGYYYLYDRPRPAALADDEAAKTEDEGGATADAEEPKQPKGASHSAEIEYALGNLDVNKVYAWEKEDYAVSQTLQGYFANFIKTGNPNGAGLPEWPRFKSGKRLVINVHTRTGKMDTLEKRYQLLDQFYLKK